MAEGVSYTTKLIFRDGEKRVTRVLPTLVSMVVEDSINIGLSIGGRSPPVIAGPWAGTEETAGAGTYKVVNVKREWLESDESCTFAVTYLLDRNTRRG